jgi:tetraacyldisaccharide 4'-kinase
MENFSEIAAAFRRADAVVTVERPADLAAAVESLLLDEPRRLALGARGRQLADLRRGATARAAARAAELHDAALPRPGRFQPLSLLWLAGVAVHRALSCFRLDLPSRPTISIGNLAMGGTGKTPLVLWLAERLAARGLKPAVLTRGYRRSSTEPVIVLLPGQPASVGQTGEEAQFILRAGHAALAIGADRQAARWALERIYRPGFYLLDDGFQHWRTRRHLDIVLIDALDPFRGGVFPHGRLREPFSALRRAGAVVITRTQPGRIYAGLRAEIRRHNASAPIFLARTTAALPDLPPGAVPGAFCGLGQPQAFLETLRALGVEPAFFEVFPDHHHYAEADLAPLAARAPLLLTTEKDLLNIPPALAARLNIRAVPSALEVEDGDRLLELVLRAGARA